MLSFKVVYSDGYYLPIGEHVFPGQKYRLTHQLLLGKRVAEPDDFVAPSAASDAEVLRVHSEQYVRKLREGTLTAKDELQLEMPYTAELAQAFWLHAGGSILAARLALEQGVSVNLGGGFHHAFPDHGEGFCMVNDLAIAIRAMATEGRVARAMVVDCDVHQGNGTAVCFNPKAVASQPQGWSAPLFQPPRSVNVKEHAAGDVFTVSLHQENNYPAWKPPSSLDVNLPDSTTDAEYLNWLDNALNLAFRQFEPDLIAFVAGADPYREDQLGGLALTIDGLKQRDEMVFGVAKARRIPVFATLAGGYARRIEDTATIHANTVIAAKEIFSGTKVRR